MGTVKPHPATPNQIKDLRSLNRRLHERVQAEGSAWFLDKFNRTAVDYRLVAHDGGLEPDLIDYVEAQDLIEWAVRWLDNSQPTESSNPK